MARWYRGIRRYKYQTTRVMEFTLKHDYGVEVNGYYIDLIGNKLRIARGYAWDGASGPTWDTKSSMRASLVHDALYQLIRENKIPMRDRRKADSELVKVAVADGMWKWRAKAWSKALKHFGKSAAKA